MLNTLRFSTVAIFLGVLLAGCGAESAVHAVSTDEVPTESARHRSMSGNELPADLTPVEDFADVPWAETPMILRASAPFTGDWGEIRERGALRVLVSYSRTNFFLAEGRLRGFEYEMFHELEKQLAGEQAKGEPPLKIAYLPVPFDELLPALLEGRGDVAAASLTVTPEREEFVAFTDPYRVGVDQILVAGAHTKDVHAWADIAGEEVHVLGGTTYVDHLERVNDDLIAAGLDPLVIVTTGRGLETEDLLELVHSGAFDYTLTDRYLAEIWSGVLDGLRLETDIVADHAGKLAWAVRPNNPLLKERLNEFTRDNKQGTMIGNVLFKRYYATTKWISNPTLSVEHSKLGPFLEPLQRHAADFGFDWLLIAAQAYQESNLDPDAVSYAGAVGLMQLLPSTAKDMGVTELHDPERNLYAGVKYMAWLRKHFFDEPQLTSEDQLDFCLAAYNAGPGRVRRWRKAAPGRGLDPDRWFGNVELLALEDVGMQPVQYVSNINKYFILFTLTLDDLERHARAREALEQQR